MLLDRLDALLVLMRHCKTKSEQDAALIRLEAEVERLHECIDGPFADHCEVCGRPGTAAPAEITPATSAA